jgi:hypothetical protein
MVVCDFDISGIAVAPDEADAPLVVDPNRVLASSIVFESLESEAWTFEVRQRRRCVEETELAQGDALEGLKSSDALLPEQPLRVLIREAPDHSAIILRRP